MRDQGMRTRRRGGRRRRLAGNDRPAPADWGLTDAHETIAVEVGPSDPHSAAVICFVMNNGI